MRDIKFRAWDKIDNKCCYPKLWDSSMPSNWGDWYDLEQFTGLKDKNGKEIYEGDIVQVKDEEYDYEMKGSVSYDENDCMFLIDGSECFETSFTKKEFEVIGNIHENPELL